MSSLSHSAVVVTNWDLSELEKAHIEAKRIFKETFFNEAFISDGTDLVTPIFKGIVNSQSTFFIVPDGSKEGWSSSDLGDKARKEFLDWLLKNDNFSDYIEVEFGGDNNFDRIIRTQETDLNRLEENND